MIDQIGNGLPPIPPGRRSEFFWERGFFANRALTEGEKSELLTELRSLGGRLQLLGIAVALSLAATVAFLTLVMASDDKKTFDNWALYIVFGLAFVIPAVLLLLVGRSAKLWSETGRALRAGYLKQFGDPATESQIETFPNSDRVWAYDGVRERSATAQRSPQPVATPEAAAIEAVWAHRCVIPSTRASINGRRELTDAEKNDILLKVWASWRRVLTTALAFSAMILADWIFDRLLHLSGKPQDLFEFGIVALVAIFYPVSMAISSTKLMRDRKRGLAIMVAIEPVGTGNRAATESNTDAPCLVEVLPESGTIWSLNGEHASRHAPP